MKQEKNKDIKVILREKINIFEEILRKTMKHMGNIKIMDIIQSSDVCNIICNLEELYEKIQNEKQKQNITLNFVQSINNDMSTLIKKYGTDDFEDLIYICFNANYLKRNINSQNKDKFEILKKYFHPTGYKVILKNNKINGENGTITEDFKIIKYAKVFDCFLNISENNSFQENIYSIKIVMPDDEKKIVLIVYGVVDDVSLKLLEYNNFIMNKQTENKKLLYQFDDFINETDKNDEIEEKEQLYKRYIDSITLKDILVYKNIDLYNRYKKYILNINYLTNNPLNETIKYFANLSLVEKREIIIELLMNNINHESEYLAYLLYDILNKDQDNNIDSQEQIILYDSLPINYKNYFKFAMKNTLNYTQSLYNYSESIPLEQQICLMKVNDIVKEKAITKLKEIKSKSEDSCSKARLYLEGLLRIPFGNYIIEDIMNVVPNSNKEYIELLQILPEALKEKINNNNNITLKNNNLIKIRKNINILNEILKENYLELFEKYIDEQKKPKLVDTIKNINNIIREENINYKKINFSKVTNTNLKENIKLFISYIKKSKLYNVTNELNDDINLIENKICNIGDNLKNVDGYMKNIDNILNNSVYGHETAKQQIKRIIGQWIVGENTGYCFGFEGPPGVGKTSLAQKGISKCLVDKDGKTRPFSFIAIGGSSNGSTLEGHNYTYVGSTWGKIVDILMDSKCMNPIIFIDELDKISNTEHGKEIIGIMTHLIDPSQNMIFQDKYFNGIDLDLSKVLFIFSYNDPSVIDRILLDRIHRVKFDRLSILDKIEITDKYLIPEITGKVGLTGNIQIDRYDIKYLINTYTNESGVRKLKEILFEIFSEINLEILSNNEKAHLMEFPIILTKELIDEYLKDRIKKHVLKVYGKNKVGVINGLWANSLGNGGILPMEGISINSSNFLELKLTGMQGDVMKESMEVAKTRAWNLLTDKEKGDFKERIKKTEDKGIHIHCPDGATPKDGPSAGAAITTLIYSILTNKKIKNTYAITGEINLQGNVTEIGGLDLKIIGGIEAGVTDFIYPKENEKDFVKFSEKYKDSNILENINFTNVEHIDEVINLIVEK